MRESSTFIIVGDFVNLGATSGSLLINCRSTLNPTPDPTISRYIASSKASGQSMAKAEQLKAAALSRDKASPAVIKHLIEGITSLFTIASLISLRTLSGIFPGNCLSHIKFTYLSTVSSHVSRLPCESSHRAYLETCMKFSY